MRANSLVVVVLLAVGGVAAWFFTRDSSLPARAERPTGAGNGFPVGSGGEPEVPAAGDPGTRAVVAGPGEGNGATAGASGTAAVAPNAPAATPAPVFDLPNDYELEAKFAGVTKEGLVEALEQRQYVLDHYATDPATGEGFVESRENPMSAEEYAVAVREAEWLKLMLAR